TRGICAERLSLSLSMSISSSPLLRALGILLQHWGYQLLNDSYLYLYMMSHAAVITRGPLAGSIANLGFFCTLFIPGALAGSYLSILTPRSWSLELPFPSMEGSSADLASHVNEADELS